MITISDIFEALTNSRPGGINLAITDAAIDSRQVIPGSIFVALPGENVDGHNFIGDAFKNGALLSLIQSSVSSDFNVIDLQQSTNLNIKNIPEPPFCILVENTLEALQKIASFWRKKLDIKVVGITGSVGKSTTKEIISGVLSQHYHTIKNPGNLNNEIGLPMTILRIGEGHQIAVLEMGFYVPGEIKLLCDIANPEIGVVTNIGSVHAERAGSRDIIARGKAELLEALPEKPNGYAVLNYDDPLVRDMHKYTKAQVIYYGLDPRADIWADEIESKGLEGIRFTFHYEDEVLNVRVPLIGRHSVHTALRAAAVGLAMGLTWEEIILGLQRSHTQLRMAAIHSDNGALIIDDSYNASPQSTLAALTLLDELDGYKIAVLGDMLELGQYEYEGHHKVGVRASEICEELYLVGDLMKIAKKAAISNGMPESQIYTFENALKAADFLKTRIKMEDVILVKGSNSLHMDRIVNALEAEE